MITMFQLDKEDVRTLIAHAYECSKEQVEISIDTAADGSRPADREMAGMEMGEADQEGRRWWKMTTAAVHKGFALLFE